MKNEMSREDELYIMNLLRQGTIKWSGRAEALKKCRKQVLIRKGLNGQPIYKFHWQCAICRKWFRDVTKMEVDHKVEIGTLSCWNEYVPKVFNRENLQCLCQGCHLKKTALYNSARSRWTRKKRVA